MDATATWGGGFGSTLEDGRGHRVLVDLPVDEGGADAGTSALELSLLSLAGCITTIFALISSKRRLLFDNLKVELHAERSAGAPTFEAVRGRMRLRTNATEEEVNVALRITMKVCPVGVLFEQAHIPVRIAVTVLPAPGSRTAPPADF